MKKDSHRGRLTDDIDDGIASWRVCRTLRLKKPVMDWKPLKYWQEQADLMILDLDMPGMHGLEVLQFVRSHKKSGEFRSSC